MSINHKNLGDDSSDLIIAFDSEFRYTYINPNVEKILNTPREQVYGKTIFEVAPHTAGTVYAINYERALKERVLIEFEEYYPPLKRWNRVRCVPQPNGGVIVFARTTTEEHIAEEERQKAMKSLQDSLTLLNAVVNGTSDIVAAFDLERKFIVANKAAANFLGFETADEILGRSDIDLVAGGAEQALLRRIKDRDDAVISSGVGETSEFVADVTPGGGRNRVYLVNKSPLRDPETGQVVGLVKVVHDITERNARELRDRFLSDASKLLNSSLDYEITLAKLAALAVPHLTDWCIIDLFDETSDHLRCVAFEHVDPEKSARGMKMRQLHPPKLDSDEGIGAVLRTGQAAFAPILNTEVLRSVTTDEESFQLLKELDFHSGVVAPILVRGNVFGAISLIATSDSGKVFTSDDLRLAEEVGIRAGLAIENARLFQKVQRDEVRQRRIADALQSSLLIHLQSELFCGVEIDAHYETALDEAFIGGDYADVFQVDENRMALLVGDCTGKGLSAARFVGECLFSLRTFLRSSPDNPAAAVALLNKMLLDGQKYDARPDDALTSLIVAVIDGTTGETTVVSAGAEPAALLRSGELVGEEIEARGLLLGIEPAISLVTVSFTMAPGDTIVLTTDGVTEARQPGSGEFFGHTRFLDIVGSACDPSESIAGTGQKIVAEAKSFAGGVLADDACVVVGRRIRV